MGCNASRHHESFECSEPVFSSKTGGDVTRIQFSATEEGFSMLYPKHSKILGSMAKRNGHSKKTRRKETKVRREQRDDENDDCASSSSLSNGLHDSGHCDRQQAAESRSTDTATTEEDKEYNYQWNHNSKSNRKRRVRQQRRSPQTYGLRAAEQYYFSDRRTNAIPRKAVWDNNWNSSLPLNRFLSEAVVDGVLKIDHDVIGASGSNRHHNLVPRSYPSRTLM